MTSLEFVQAELRTAQLDVERAEYAVEACKRIVSTLRKIEKQLLLDEEEEQKLLSQQEEIENRKVGHPLL